MDLSEIWHPASGDCRGYGQSFGLMDPVVLDLGILVITFGLSIRVTMASIIGVVIALIAYRLI